MQIVIEEVVRFGDYDYGFVVRPPTEPMWADIKVDGLAITMANLRAQIANAVGAGILPKGISIQFTQPGIVGGPAPTAVKVAHNSLYGVVGWQRPKSYSPVFVPGSQRATASPRWWRRAAKGANRPQFEVVWRQCWWRLRRAQAVGGAIRLDPPPWWHERDPGETLSREKVEDQRRACVIDWADVNTWREAVAAEARKTAHAAVCLAGRRQPEPVSKARESGVLRRRRACGLDGRWRASLA